MPWYFAGSAAETRKHRSFASNKKCACHFAKQMAGEHLSFLDDDYLLSGIIERDALARVQSGNSHAERD